MVANKEVLSNAQSDYIKNGVIVLRNILEKALKVSGYLVTFYFTV